MGKRGKRALAASIVVLATAAAVWGGTGAFTGAAASSGTTAASGSGVGSDGIKVHGHWKLTVVNPDGSVARTTEFENSLVSDGANLLRDVLGNVGVPGQWEIALDSSGDPKPCHDEANTGFPCFINQGGGPPNPNPVLFPTLSVNTSNPGTLILAGRATVQTTSSIDVVTTLLWFCGQRDVSLKTCFDISPSDILDFTRKTGADTDKLPVDVQAGQVVQVSVRLSFS